MTKIFPLVLLALATTFANAAKQSDLEKNATEAVKRMMKDPESTQFRDLRTINNKTGKNAICGEVNSKNSYGGYVGFTPFSYSEEGVAIVNSSDRSYSAKLNLQNYQLSGCDGEKSEIIARNPEMFNNYCQVAYQLFEDVLADNKTRDEAIDKAMTEYQNRGLVVFNSDLSLAKTDLLKNLDEVSKTPEAVKRIKKKDKSFKQTYSFTCPSLTEGSYRLNK